jgi:hypothetical protein
MSQESSKKDDSNSIEFFTSLALFFLLSKSQSHGLFRDKMQINKNKL